LEVINIADPAHCVAIGGFVTGGEAYGVVGLGDYAYVADGSAGLEVIDIKAPYGLNHIYRRVDSKDTANLAVGVAALGEYVCVADETRLLKVFNVANPSNCVQVSDYDTGGAIEAVAVNGHYAYLASGDMRVVDLRDPANPIKVGECATPGFANAIAVAGNFAYVSDLYSGLQVIDVSNPTNCVRVGGYDTTGVARGVAVAGHYAYVADYNGGLQVIDVSDPTNCVRVGGWQGSIGYAKGVVISSNLAYVAYQTSVQAIDISDPTNCRCVGTYYTQGAALGVTMCGDKICVAQGVYGLDMLTTESGMPRIDVQPLSVTTNAGATATFEVVAGGSPPSGCQWYKDESAMADGTNVSGASSSTLTLNNVGVPDAAAYRVVVTNQFGSVTSIVATLTVVTVPVITVQPTNQMSIPGGTAGYSVVAIGPGPLSYDWKRDGVSITDPRMIGLGSATLTITALTTNDAGSFCVVVSNVYGSVTSSIVTLTVAVPGTVPRLVWDASPSPTSPYVTWATAAHTIQDAVDAAFVGDVVLVTNGMYTGGGGAANGPNRVAITTPLTVRSVNGPEMTTIDGAATMRCAFLGSGVSLIGFTLRNGFANEGGGAWGDGATAMVSNCIIVANYATSFGGGVFGGTVANCIVRSNASGWHGGGAQHNTAIRSVLEDNSTVDAGGGAFDSTVWNCRIRRNRAYSGGGTAESTVYNSLVSSNRAEYTGGGGYGGFFMNCTITGNTSDYWGGGVSAIGVENCIIRSNSAPSFPWRDVDNYFATQVEYSCTTPIPFPDWHNIDADPRIADDFHLGAGSPCIGAGSAAYAKGTDLDGQPWGNPPSIGCDEIRSEQAPVIVMNDGYCGFHSNLFGFNITATAGQSIVIEASTNLLDWTALLTNTPSTESFYFSDDGSTNLAQRFYRLRLW
jgi:hypothetical protein